MVTVDHNTNIQRIVDVITADTNVTGIGASTVGLLRSVEFGDPSNQTEQTFPMPYAYVTTASSLQTSSPEIGMSIADNVKSVTVEYQIVIVAHAEDKTETSQKQLYDLIKNMRTLTEGNPTFTDPANPGTDPIFVRSVINNVDWNQNTRGGLMTVIRMTLLATIGVLFTLTVPGITDPIPLISKPIDRDVDTIEDIIDDTLIIRDIAPVKSKRIIMTEFETSSTDITTLRTIKLSRASNTYTIISPSGSEDVTAYLTQLEDSPGFSDMETTIIQLDVVTPV